MKRGLGLCLLFCVFLPLLLCACEPEPSEEQGLYAYFLSRDKEQPLTQAEYVCMDEDTHVFALEKMLVDPERPDCQSAFPYGVSLLSLTVEEGLATVDLSSPYDTLRGFSLSLANACAVRTLTQFDDVSQVKIRVEGRIHPALKDRLYTAEDFLDIAPES